MLGIAAVLLVIAVLGKLAAAAGMFGSPGDRLLVGIGMIPRGEVGLIFATLGLSEARLRPGRVRRADPRRARDDGRYTDRCCKAGGCSASASSGERASPTATSGTSDALVSVDSRGRVTIAGEPLPSQALGVALAAARLCRAASTE